MLDVALQAEELLDAYNYNGNGHDRLRKNDPDAQLANQLANSLDRYNNGEFCGDGIVQTEHGEICDDGVNDGTSAVPTMYIDDLRIGTSYADVTPIPEPTTLGAIALGAALAAHLIMGWEWRQAVLFGTLVIVTGPTVIGPMLRQIRPAGGVAPILNCEGIVTDPLGVMIAVLAFESLIHHGGGMGAAKGVALTIGLGSACGVVAMQICFTLSRATGAMKLR